MADDKLSNHNCSTNNLKSIKMENNKTHLSRENFENIRSHLLKFGGGQVSLTKNAKTGIATLLLDHPEKRNAMSGKMMVELRDCIETLEQWNEGKAVILSGRGNNFCSGGDLDFAKANATPQQGMNMAIWMQDALKRLKKLPMISICLAHGPTLGGGAEMSIFCDFIVAADNVKYGFVHGKLGITTAWGGGVSLANKIGPSKALDMLLTSKILNAKECLRMGIVDVIVPADIAFGKTIEWLTPRLQHNYDIIRAFKKIVVNSQCYLYEDALELEKIIFAPFWGSRNNQEALGENIKHRQKSHI